MFTLTYREVAEKAKEYYFAKKLTAQHPDKDKRQCVNDGGDGYRCAVAASYPEDFKGEGSFIFFVSTGIIKAEPFDAIKIQRIQDAHDAWAALSRISEDPLVLHHLEHMFKASIGIADALVVGQV